MNTIRQLRQQNNLTMKELGSKIGVAESTISLYECQKRQIPDDYFGVSVDYLLGRETDSLESAIKKAGGFP